jgi:hypothetical protein
MIKNLGIYGYEAGSHIIKNLGWCQVTYLFRDAVDEGLFQRTISGFVQISEPPYDRWIVVHGVEEAQLVKGCANTYPQWLHMDDVTEINAAPRQDLTLDTPLEGKFDHFRK